MAIPAQQNAKVAARKIAAWVEQLRGETLKYIAQCDAGSLNLMEFTIGFLKNTLSRAKVEWALHAAVPGVGEAVEREFPHKTFDGDTEIANVAAALDTLIGQIEQSSILTDASNRLLVTILRKDGSGQMDPRLLTGAGALATARAQLVSFRDVFDVS